LLGHWRNPEILPTVHNAVDTRAVRAQDVEHEKRHPLDPSDDNHLAAAGDNAQWNVGTRLEPGGTPDDRPTGVHQARCRSVIAEFGDGPAAVRAPVVSFRLPP